MSKINIQISSIEILKKDVVKMLETNKSAKKVVICRVEYVPQSGCIVM